jgi:hypothetical protein
MFLRRMMKEVRRITKKPVPARKAPKARLRIEGLEERQMLDAAPTFPVTFSVVTAAPAAPTHDNTAIFDLISQGDTLRASGDLAGARSLYVSAYQTAYAQSSVEGMLALSERYLSLANNPADDMPNDDQQMVRNTFAQATTFADDWAESTVNNPNVGTDPAYGMNGLQQCRDFYDGVLAGEVPAWENDLKYQRDQADNNFQRLNAQTNSPTDPGPGAVPLDPSLFPGMNTVPSSPTDQGITDTSNGGYLYGYLSDPSAVSLATSSLAPIQDGYVAASAGLGIPMSLDGQQLADAVANTNSTTDTSGNSDSSGGATSATDTGGNTNRYTPPVAPVPPATAPPAGDTNPITPVAPDPTSGPDYPPPYPLPPEETPATPGSVGSGVSGQLPNTSNGTGSEVSNAAVGTYDGGPPVAGVTTPQSAVAAAADALMWA